MATISTLGLTVGNWKLNSSPPSAATTAMTTESMVTPNGLALRRWAAAAGVMARLSTSSVPTICAASVTVTASTKRKTMPSTPVRHAAGLGHVGVDRREQQRPPDHGQHDGHDHGDDAEQEDLVGADAEDVAEEDVQGLAGVAVVVAEQEHAEPQAGRQDHADGRVALGVALAEQPDQRGDDERADQRAGQRVVGDQQPGRRRR